MREEAQHFEAIKYSLRQSKDGVVVAFVVQPHDVTPGLMALPVGARVMIAWSAIGDDEKPVASVASTKTPAGASTSLEPPQALKAKRKFSDLHLWEQAGIRCADPKFWQFYQERYGYAVENAEEAARLVRGNLRVSSRSELGRGNKDADTRWVALDLAFRQWMTDQQYAESRRG